MSFHKDSVGDGNHAVTSKTYADITARDADTAFQVAANIDKVVRVNSVPVGYWLLESISPSTWTAWHDLQSLAQFTTTNLTEGTNLYYTDARVDTEIAVNSVVAANTTHKTSNGTDHTFIDQDLTVTASPTFVEKIVLTSTDRNTSIGPNTLPLSSGMDNVAVGNDALKLNTIGTGNTAIGSGALRANTEGTANIAIGIGLPANTTGDFNVAFNGCNANTIGNRNMGIGVNTLGTNLSGNNNVAIGLGALTLLSSGSNNVAIGDEAGHGLLGSGSVCIGAMAGHFETGSNKLYIANTNTSTPLLYGDFGAATLKINGALEVAEDISLGSANKKFIVYDSGTGEWLGTGTGNSGELGIMARQKVVIHIDADNDSTTNHFSIRKDSNVIMGGTEIFRVQEDGKVGIGINNPAELLDVAGAALIQGSMTVNGLFRNYNSMVVHGRISIEDTGSSVFIGQNAGNSDDLVANHNVGVGDSALKANVGGIDNTGVGYHALISNISGTDNVAMGAYTLIAVTTGDGNIALGTNALSGVTLSSNNIGIGYEAGWNITTAASNVCIGAGSLQAVITGAGENTALGHEAGYTTTGSGNVFLGYTAGFYATGSDQLFIDNSTTADPLIYGEFNNNLLRINGFTQLGDSTAPKIKQKKLTGTTGATEGDTTSVAHGLTMGKILAIDVLVTLATARIPPVTTDAAGYEYEALATTSYIDVNMHATNSENILSKGFTILLTYEE